MKNLLILASLLCFCGSEKSTNKEPVVDTVKVYDTTRVSIVVDVLPDYQLCDDIFTITGVISTPNERKKYMYVTTDGCSDKIGRNDGFQILSDNEYKVGDKLHFTSEY